MFFRNYTSGNTNSDLHTYGSDSYFKWYQLFPKFTDQVPCANSFDSYLSFIAVISVAFPFEAG